MLIQDLTAEIRHVELQLAGLLSIAPDQVEELRQEGQLGLALQRKPRDPARLPEWMHYHNLLGVFGDDRSSALEVEVAAATRSVDSVVSSDTVEGWALRALHEADVAIRRCYDGALEDTARAGVQALKPAAGALARRGAARVRDVLYAAGAGDMDRARELWIEPDATWQEHLKLLRDVTILAASEQDQAEKDWEEFKASVVRAGQQALKAAIPFLIAAIAAA